MKITILTTFPEMFTPLHTSMLGRAEKAELEAALPRQERKLMTQMLPLTRASP